MFLAGSHTDGVMHICYFFLLGFLSKRVSDCRPEYALWSKANVMNFLIKAPLNLFPCDIPYSGSFPSVGNFGRFFTEMFVQMQMLWLPSWQEFQPHEDTEKRKIPVSTSQQLWKKMPSVLFGPNEAQELISSAKILCTQNLRMLELGS